MNWSTARRGAGAERLVGRSRPASPCPRGCCNMRSSSACCRRSAGVCPASTRSCKREARGRGPSGSWGIGSPWDRVGTRRGRFERTGAVHGSVPRVVHAATAMVTANTTTLSRAGGGRRLIKERSAKDPSPGAACHWPIGQVCYNPSRPDFQHPNVPQRSEASHVSETSSRDFLDAGRHPDLVPIDGLLSAGGHRAARRPPSPASTLATLRRRLWRPWSPIRGTC